MDVLFGRLFSNIKIDRKLDNSVSGETIQTLKVPIMYGHKEKWLTRVEQDPSLENTTHMLLPAMSYEMIGYYYNKDKQMNKLNRLVCMGEDGVRSVYNPVPYVINMELHILSKNNEDVYQIVEQILPLFSPNLEVKIKSIPILNINDTINISIINTNIQDDNTGSFENNRILTHTISFAIECNFYGPVNSDTGGIIEHLTLNFRDFETGYISNQYKADGDIVTGIITETFT
jgi:hypothetical protein